MANSVWQGTVQDASGNIVTGAEISVYDEGTGTLATIYSDIGGTALANPFFSDSNGFAQFYAAAGQYRITAVEAGSGLNQTFRHVRLGEAGSVDTGTASDEVPLNSDLPTFGTAAEADTGTGTGQLPTADQLNMVGAGVTNWTGNNLLNDAPISVNVNNGTAYSLPTGGTWDYWMQGFTSSQLMTGSSVSGRAAGGAEVYSNAGVSFIRGWAKKVSA